MAIVQSALFPARHFFAFAPFLAILCLSTPFHSALWLAALAGCCQDFLVSDPPGIHALTYTILVSFLHRLQRNFKEHPLQLPLFSALIAAVAFPIGIFILFIFEGSVQGLILFDFFEEPLLAGLYAFFWFVGPLVLCEWIGKQWKTWKVTRENS